MLFSIIGAGVDSTASLLANVFDYLDANPQLREPLLESPELLARSCEEFLRYFSPVQILARTVTRDTEIRGQRLDAGDRLALAWGAANFDPDVFGDPEQIQMDRWPNRHVAFGSGIHRCLGSNLARAEFNAIVPAVLSRMGDYRIDRSACLRYPTIGLVNGWAVLPATFTPGVRLNASCLRRPVSTHSDQPPMS